MSTSFLVQEDPSMLHRVAEAGTRARLRVQDPQILSARPDSVGVVSECCDKRSGLQASCCSRSKTEGRMGIPMQQH